MTNLFSILIISTLIQGDFYIPISSINRQNISKIQLSNIGEFGLKRRARPNVPEHYHTGIDIKRPNNNYGSEPIYPIAKGKIISKRTDGPYANIIMEHEINGIKLWSLYEHISGINVNVSDIVNPTSPIARFMNKDELNQYGWQFDHFHLEIIKIKPQILKPTKENSERFFNSYSLICFSTYELNKYYFDPIEFFKIYLK